MPLFNIIGFAIQYTYFFVYVFLFPKLKLWAIQQNLHTFAFVTINLTKQKTKNGKKLFRRNRRITIE